MIWNATCWAPRRRRTRRSRSTPGWPGWPARSGGARCSLAGRNRPSTAVMLCHPTANFLGHYALAGLAERGFGAIGFTTRYVGNDTSLIMENCLLDMGDMVHHLYERGYERVVLVGNSGGASIVPYYQAQARRPDGDRAAGRRARPHHGRPATRRRADHAQRPSVAGPAEHRMARPGDRRRAPALRARPVARHVQPRQRAAVRGRVRGSLPGRPGGPQPPDLGVGRGAAADARERRRTGRPGSTTWPSSCTGTAADLRFLDGAIDPSDRRSG